MPRPQTFHPFMKLPPELRGMVWKFHAINRRSKRHYFAMSEKRRLYAAIDTYTDTFADTFIRKSMVGESCTRLIGKNFTPPPGGQATPLINMLKSRLLTEKIGPYICINFEKDVVYFGYGASCLRVLFPLNRRVTDSEYVNLAVGGHWLGRIRHLAIQFRNCRSIIKSWDMKAIKPLARSSELETLYLVTFMDPSCPHGPPRRWPGFSREMLDEHDFLPVEKFIRLHPMVRGSGCDCNLVGDVGEITYVTNKFLKGYYWPVTKGRPCIKVVADPYGFTSSGR